MDIIQGGQLRLHLLEGCLVEAERADVVAYRMDELRRTLPGPPQPHLMVTTEEIKTSSQILRDLADHSQIHFSRVPVVLDYLEIVLPCLSRSLRDITAHYEDQAHTLENRWRRMYHTMTEEAGGLPIQQRFVLYNHFLILLRELLTR